MKKFVAHTFLICLICSAQVSKKSNTEYNSIQDRMSYARRSSLAARLPCTLDSLLTRLGTWEKGSDESPFPDPSFPKNQHKYALAILDKIFPMMEEALPDLHGFEPRWYRSISGRSYVPNGPLPYQFSGQFFMYYCNTNVNKLLLQGETGTFLNVYINDWGWLCSKVENWDINNDGKAIGVFNLPPKVGVWKGKPLYAPTVLDSNRAIVLGHKGKLPWHSLTQKQYLTGLRNWYAKLRDESLIRNDEGIEKMKKNIGVVGKNLDPERAAKIKAKQEADVKKAEDNRENFRQIVLKQYQENVKFINEYLANTSEEELKKPAIIHPLYNSLKFEGKFGDEDKGGTRVIAFSSKYFDNTLPRHSPQFMVLYWRWRRDPVSMNFRKQFEEHFPLEKLKELIDK